MRTSRQLVVVIVRAHGVIAMDFNGKSDPWVKVKFGDKVKKTQVIKKTLEPEWNEDFSFPIDEGDDFLKTPLHLTMLDKDLISSDFMGQCVIDLEEKLEDQSGFNGWISLWDKNMSKREHGSLHVKIIVRSGQDAARKSIMAKALDNIELKEEELKLIDLKLFIGSWNVGNEIPPDDLSPWIPQSGFDLYAIGTQENQYSNSDILVASDWNNRLKEHLGEDFILISTNALMQIKISLFARSNLVSQIFNLKTAREATGIANVLGNKGGVCIAFDIQDTSFCFINAHLAAHQHMKKRRNEDYKEILHGLGDNLKCDILSHYHSVFWMGDLNYRVDFGNQEEKAPTPEQFKLVTDMIDNMQLKDLMEKDQLRNEMKRGNCFYGFQEGHQLFDCKPTFKVIKGVDFEYSVKRTPSWCDRILWNTKTEFDLLVQLESYSSAPKVMTSDHKPVSATFNLKAFLLPRHSPSYGRAVLKFIHIDVKGVPPNCDSYVRLDCKPFEEPFVSVFREDQTNPVWERNELPAIVIPLKFNHVEFLKYQFIEVKVLDEKAGSRSKRFIGGCAIPLLPLVDNASHEVNVGIAKDGIKVGEFNAKILLTFEKELYSKRSRFFSRIKTGLGLS